MTVHMTELVGLLFSTISSNKFTSNITHTNRQTKDGEREGTIFLFKKQTNIKARDLVLYMRVLIRM